jgi:uncharacterized protein (DUF2236 family)
MTVAERINAERVVLAGWSRAILLQLAHPLVAQGVADHSTFRGGMFMAAVRLHHTVGAMRQLTFGTAPEAQRALEGILAIHRRVNGHLTASVGGYPAGTPYSAEDAALVLWVHATLMDSLPLVYEAVVAPLTDDDRDQWCRESAPVARALGATSDVPESWAALQAYMAGMYASGRIVVGDTARGLSRDVLSPRLSSVIAPVRAINRLVTVGLLPAGVRAQYGFSWTAADDARVPRVLRALRLARRVTPRLLAHWPDARR